MVTRRWSQANAPSLNGFCSQSAHKSLGLPVQTLKLKHSVQGIHDLICPLLAPVNDFWSESKTVYVDHVTVWKHEP